MCIFCPIELDSLVAIKVSSYKGGRPGAGGGVRRPASPGDVADADRGAAGAAAEGRVRGPWHDKERRGSAGVGAAAVVPPPAPLAQRDGQLGAAGARLARADTRGGTVGAACVARALHHGGRLGGWPPGAQLSAESGASG